MWTQLSVQYCHYVAELSVDVDGSFFFQAEDGIRDLVRSRGLGDVYKRQVGASVAAKAAPDGYTYFMGAVHHSIAPSMYPKLDLSLIHI